MRTQRHSVLSFRAVNRRDHRHYRPGLLRHHLLPREMIHHPGFRRLLDALGLERIGFEDFRRNGMLLPCDDAEAARMGLPLHRGPHRTYNAMVLERAGAIEADWQSARRRDAVAAQVDALVAVDRLQRAMRRHLLDPAGWRALPLNRRDPSVRDRALDYA